MFEGRRPAINFSAPGAHDYLAGRYGGAVQNLERAMELRKDRGRVFLAEGEELWRRHDPIRPTGELTRRLRQRARAIQGSVR